MGIGISNKAQEAYQYQTEAVAIKRRYPDGAKSDASNLPRKTNQRDVLEVSASNQYEDYYNDYDGYGNLKEFADYLRYRFTHTVGHNVTWVLDEVGNDLHNRKEEKGAYNGSDMLNSYGYTYARLYADIEENYENGDELWFDLSGKPLTKEEAKAKELEELNKGYDAAVGWAAMCAESAVWCQKMRDQNAQAPNFEKPAQEVPEIRQKDLEELKRALYETRDRYMELYKECKQTGNLLTRQNYIFSHNALLSFIAKTWSEYKHE